MVKIVIGVLIFIAAGAVLLVFWSYRRWNDAIGADIRRLTASAARDVVVVTEAMLAPLPAPVQRYLRYSGVVGKPIPATVRLTQRGRIRSAPTASWMNLEATEYYSTQPPAFVWKASLPTRSLPFVLGRDEYLDGKGSILMKMLAVYRVADESGGPLGEAALMRYLNEMTWFPAAFLGSNVTWRGIDDASAEVTLSDRGMTATAALFLDVEGRLTNFRAERFNTGTQSRETWETPITGYGEFAGRRLPSRGAAVWRLRDGDFTYIELEISDVSYDVLP
jgi:hypothetical protein